MTGSGTITASPNPLLLGKRNPQDGRNFPVDGRLDEVAIWSRALSDSEIATLYNDGVASAVANILPSATSVQIAAAGTLALGGETQQVASLSDYAPGSGGNILNSNTGAASILTLSPTGGSTTFSGSIMGGGTLGTISLVMSGSGRQVLAGSNSYTGATTINQGELIVNGSLLSPVTVNSGGTLGGTGYLGSVTVNAGGHLAPGDAPGVLHLSGNLVLASSASLGL